VTVKQKWQLNKSDSKTKVKEQTGRWEWHEIISHQHASKNYKISYTAASSVIPLISMGGVSYAYECKYTERNM